MTNPKPAAQRTAGDVRRGMVVVGAFVMLLSMGTHFRVPVLPSVGADLSMNASQLGLITTAYALGRLATDLPAGRLADRFSPLRSLTLAGVMLAAGSASFALAPSGAWVIGSAVVFGVSAAIANTAGMTYFSQAAPTHQRGMAMAWFSAALLGGQSFGPAVGGVIADLTGWRPAIGVAAGIGSLVVFASLVVAQSKRSVAEVPAPHGGAETSGHPAAIPTLQRWLLYSVGFGNFFMLGAIPQTLVAIIGSDRLTLGAGAIGLALGLGGVSRLVGALVGGRVADRFARKVALVPGMVLGAAGVAMLAVDAGVTSWLIAVVLLSLGTYPVSIGATMLADHAGGRRVGRRLGKYRFAGDLGLVTGPALSTLLYQHVSPPAAVLLVAGVLAVIALLCALLLTETRWLVPLHSPPAPGGAA